MPNLTWTEDCRIGIDSLDYEHQDLFERINELHAALARHDTKDAVAATLGEIHARMAAHFALEEKVMRDGRYKGYAAHKAEHERLLDHLTEIIETFDAGDSPRLEADLEAELERWIVGHVLTSDRRMADMLET